MTNHHPSCPALRCVYSHPEITNGYTCLELESNHVDCHKFQPGPCNCGKEELERLRDLVKRMAREMSGWPDMLDDEGEFDAAKEIRGLIAEAEGGDDK